MRDDGVALVWTLPWDGTKGEALLPNRLHPYYIEICRRIRLRVDADGDLYGLKTSSKAARIEAKSLKGITGDPWIPINRKESKALTLANGGFTYKTGDRIPHLSELGAARALATDPLRAGLTGANVTACACVGAGAGQDRRLLRTHHSNQP